MGLKRTRLPAWTSPGAGHRVLLEELAHVAAMVTELLTDERPT
jgi:hypothetical protein